jgi:flagellar motor switch protein FliM
VRNLGSSLSAYLRSYLTVNLVSVEQLSYGEFLEGLPSPTCITSLSLEPYEGNAVLELNPSIIFPVLEMLLGGNGKNPSVVQREITEIEQSLLDGLFRSSARPHRGLERRHIDRLQNREHGEGAATAPGSGAK